jgi:hypothetical protein
VLVLAALLLASARPLFYWGARPPVIATEVESRQGVEAQVLEVHAALDGGALLLRFTFDRPVEEATHVAGGAPVSGRLRAVLYVDADGDRATGWDTGSGDLRTGAEYRLEVGVVALGADADEKLAAQALVTASLVTLGREGRRKTVWRVDDAGVPPQVSVHGEWVELKVPATEAAVRERARLILTAGERTWDGVLRP